MELEEENAEQKQWQIKFKQTDGDSKLAAEIEN